MDRKRRTAVSVFARDICAHLGEWGNDPVHRTGFNGSISVQNRRKVLTGEDPGDQSGCCSAVSDIECLRRRCKAMQSFSVNADRIVVTLYRDSHILKTGDRREAVGTL